MTRRGLFTQIGAALTMGGLGRLAMLATPSAWTRAQIAGAHVWYVELSGTGYERVFLGVMSKAGDIRWRALDVAVQGGRRIGLAYLHEWARAGAPIDKTVRWSTDTARTHRGIAESAARWRTSVLAK